MSKRLVWVFVLAAIGGGIGAFLGGGPGAAIGGGIGALMGEGKRG